MNKIHSRIIVLNQLYSFKGLIWYQSTSASIFFSCFFIQSYFLPQISTMTDSKDSSSMNSTSDSQGSNDLFSAQGPNDPFFVHHLDNPTDVIVSLMLLGDNYNTGTLIGITPQANLTGISLSCSYKSVWIIDSGATNHVSSSLNLFSSYSTCSKHSTLKLPDGTNHLITHVGTVTLSPTLCLTNVLFVPTFQFNLISIS